MESKTQTGLLLLIIGFSIISVFTLIMPFTNLITLDFNTMTSIGMVAIVIAVIIGAILSLAGAIFFLRGGNEFGEKHHKNVNFAYRLFIICYVLLFVISIFLPSVLYSTIPSISEIGITPSSIIFVIRTIVSAIIGGLIFYYALIELENELGKKVLFSAIVSSICISVIISTISLSNIEYQIREGVQILSVFPLFIYIFALYIPYTRIKQGKLNVQLPAYPSKVQTRNCPNCNNQIPFDSLLCPYCGVKSKK